MSAAQAPYYIVRENELLHEGKYKVVSILGKGSFGIVVKAEIASPAPDGRPTQVAIKIIRKGASFLAQGRREFKVLHYIHQNSQIRDEAHNFIVNAVETFFHDGHLCIVFELLSDTLFELLQRSWSAPATQQPGLSLRMVCKMAHQLLCALVTLRNLKVIHCDLKPENIALTSPNRPRIKILDFGSCCFASEEPCNQFPYIQSRYYRAPEVLLGTGYSCAIDVWSLGCIMVELFVGKPLFIGENAIQQLYRIIEVLGMPPESMLRRSAHLSKFFNRTPRGLEPTQNWPGRIDVGKNDLRKIITAKPEANQPQHVEFFLDLVTRMLKWDPTERISPLEALNHPFVRNGPRGAPNAASAAAAAAGSGAPQATQLAAPQQQQQQAHAAAAPIYAFPPPGAWTDRQR
jgi:serine/threonine protein kinase